MCPDKQPSTHQKEGKFIVFWARISFVIKAISWFVLVFVACPSSLFHFSSSESIFYLNCSLERIKESKKGMHTLLINSNMGNFVFSIYLGTYFMQPLIVVWVASTTWKLLTDGIVSCLFLLLLPPFLLILQFAVIQNFTLLWYVLVG